MTTLIRPTYVHATFFDTENPDIIISTEELSHEIAAIKGDGPAMRLAVDRVVKRQVPMHPIAALFIMGKVESTMPVFETVEDIKYPHFVRMLAGEITTVEYDSISAHIEAENKAA